MRTWNSLVEVEENSRENEGNLVELGSLLGGHGRTDDDGQGEKARRTGKHMCGYLSSSEDD